MNAAVPVPTSSEMRDITKSMHICPDSHSNGKSGRHRTICRQFDAKKGNAKRKTNERIRTSHLAGVYDLGYLSTPKKMPHRRIQAHYEQLTEFKRGAIVGLNETGWANWIITGHMGRSDAAIRRCWQE
ncbi:hypothetical protein TNCV_1633401 [Trichonephila clavipes]|nr:hypothetical protein TNCV_1633401 [Trichonephila clavipes]